MAPERVVLDGLVLLTLVKLAQGICINYWIHVLVFCPVAALFVNIEKTTKLYLLSASTAMLNIRFFVAKIKVLRALSIV